MTKEYPKYCRCVYEPRGDHGLEGYNLGDVYRYETKRDNDGTEYVRVYPQDDPFELGKYYETCSVSNFNKYFEKVQHKEEES